jgi:hypothetical protein
MLICAQTQTFSIHTLYEIFNLPGTTCAVKYHVYTRYLRTVDCLKCPEMSTLAVEKIS